MIGLVNFKAVKHAWQASRHDGIAAVVTFIATLAFAPHLDNGIMVGAGLALGLYLYRTMSPRVAMLGRYKDGTLRDIKVNPDLPTSKHVVAIRFDGSLYFANVAYFEDAMLEAVSKHPDAKYVLVVGDGINQLDASGEEVIHHLVDRLKGAGITLVFSGLKKQVLDVMRATGLFEAIGQDKLFATEDQRDCRDLRAAGRRMRRTTCSARSPRHDKPDGFRTPPPSRTRSGIETMNFLPASWKHYTGNLLKADLTAGLIVAVVSIPLGLAFAIASGATPIQGLLTSVVAGSLVAIFGGSRFQIAGAAAALIPVLAAISLTSLNGFQDVMIAGMMAGRAAGADGLAALRQADRVHPPPGGAGLHLGHCDQHHRHPAQQRARTGRDARRTARKSSTPAAWSSACPSMSSSTRTCWKRSSIWPR